MTISDDLRHATRLPSGRPRELAGRIADALGDNAGLLTDERLESVLRALVAEAQRRPSMRQFRRQFLAAALGEEKAEMLVASGLSAEDIAAITAPERMLEGV